MQAPPGSSLTRQPSERREVGDRRCSRPEGFHSIVNGHADGGIARLDDDHAYGDGFQHWMEPFKNGPMLIMANAMLLALV